MSVCLSCGYQRDNCEICGGDLEDAHAYNADLREEKAALLAENRIIVGTLEDADGLAYGFDTTELAALAAAEVARVKGLEAVADAAFDCPSWHPSLYKALTELWPNGRPFALGEGA
jgi:hypothetical protein